MREKRQNNWQVLKIFKKKTYSIVLVVNPLLSSTEQRLLDLLLNPRLDRLSKIEN